MNKSPIIRILYKPRPDWTGTATTERFGSVKLCTRSTTATGWLLTLRPRLVYLTKNGATTSPRRIITPITHACMVMCGLATHRNISRLTPLYLNKALYHSPNSISIITDQSKSLNPRN